LYSSNLIDFWQQRGIFTLYKIQYNSNLSDIVKRPVQLAFDNICAFDQDYDSNCLSFMHKAAIQVMFVYQTQGQGF
jgi:hypothetical protein